MPSSERVVFQGITYYRYPDSDRPSHRAYFQRPGKTLHRAIWEHHNGPVPPGHEIHHKDHDTLNNDPRNLVCVEVSAHRRESAHSRRRFTYECAWCGEEFEAFNACPSPRRYCCIEHRKKDYNRRYYIEVERDRRRMKRMTQRKESTP